MLIALAFLQENFSFSIVHAGFDVANINGTSYSSGQTLPNNWTVYTEGSMQFFRGLSGFSLFKTQPSGSDSGSGYAKLKFTVNMTGALGDYAKFYVKGLEKKGWGHTWYFSRPSSVVKLFSNAAGVYKSTHKVGSFDDNLLNEQFTQKVVKVYTKGLAISGANRSCNIEFPVGKIAVNTYGSQSATSGNSNMTTMIAGSLAYHGVSFNNVSVVATGWMAGSINSYDDRIMVGVFSGGGGEADQYALVNETPGYYELFPMGYPSGNYEIKIWAKSSLKKSVTLVWDGSTMQSTNVTLIYGDLNQDNYVSSIEAQYVQDCIGLNSGSALWNSTTLLSDGSFMVPDNAVIDCDGDVDSADYALVSANVGISGS